MSGTSGSLRWFLEFENTARSAVRKAVSICLSHFKKMKKS